MENKTVEENNDLQINLIIANWMDRQATGNSEVYMAELDLIRGAVKEYASQQCAELQKRIELLEVRDGKREKRLTNLNKENGGLYGELEAQQSRIHQLQDQLIDKQSENESLKKLLRESFVAIDNVKTWDGSAEQWEFIQSYLNKVKAAL